MSKTAFVLKVLAGMGLAIVVAQPTWAQTAGSADLLTGTESQDALTNLFNGRSDNSSSGLMDLIQRVSQGAVDPEAFRQQQRENIDAATADFLQKRQRALQSQPQVAPTNPVTPVNP